MARRPDDGRLPFDQIDLPGPARRLTGWVMLVAGAFVCSTCTQPTPRDAPKSAAAPVVKPPSASQPPSIAIDLSDTTSIQVGDTIAPTVVATATPSSDDPLIHWSSSDSSVIAVQPDGRIRAVGEGRAVLQATYAGLTNQRVVNVGATTFIGAGDIGVCQTPYAAATADVIDTVRGRVFTVGDNTYPIGAASEWSDCWVPTWGRFKNRTIPALGNHDVAADGATAYFDYWGSRVGVLGRGYYSVNIGTWHIVVLNSETDVSANSVQNQWLAADLQASANSLCTIAIWHRPRFSSSQDEPGDSAMAPLWRTLFAHHADIIINGHSHDYERFTPQTPAGVADTVTGIREFVVGTGGAMLFPFGAIAANSEVRQAATHGVLRFTLHARSYDWQFIPIPGDPPFTDAGRATCSH